MLYWKVKVAFTERINGMPIWNERLPFVTTNQIKNCAESLLWRGIQVKGTRTAHVDFIVMLDRPSWCSGSLNVSYLRSIIYSCFIAWSKIFFLTKEAHAAKSTITAGVEWDLFELAKVWNRWSWFVLEERYSMVPISNTGSDFPAGPVLVVVFRAQQCAWTQLEESQLRMRFASWMPGLIESRLHRTIAWPGFDCEFPGLVDLKAGIF